jgi:hypothetical protein
MPKSIAARFGMTQSPKLLSQWIAGPGCSGLTDHARPRTGTSFAVTTKLTMLRHDRPKWRAPFERQQRAMPAQHSTTVDLVDANEEGRSAR